MNTQEYRTQVLAKLDEIGAALDYLHVELHNIRAALAYGDTATVEDRIAVMPEGKEILHGD